MISSSYHPFRSIRLPFQKSHTLKKETLVERGEEKNHLQGLSKVLNRDRGSILMMVSHNERAVDSTGLPIFPPT